MTSNETVACSLWTLADECLKSPLNDKTEDQYNRSDNAIVEGVGPPHGAFSITPLVSRHTYTIFFIVIVLALRSPLALVGCITNVINIVVYLKMGLGETTTINILALSTFDLIACITMFLTAISLNPFTAAADLRLPSGAPLAELGFCSAIVLYPSLGCGAWITALLSVERCLCIVLPLKVKTLVTVQRTALVIAVVIAYEVTFVVIMFVWTGPPYNPSRASSANRKTYLMYAFSIPSCACFLVILISTIFLVTRLGSYRNQAAWLNASQNTSSSTSDAANKKAQKEQKAARFVILICVIYLVCFAPNTIMYLVNVLLLPNLTTADPYLGWLTHILFFFSSLFQTVSSAINIFVYYSMGTKYRTVFRSIFFAGKQELK